MTTSKETWVEFNDLVSLVNEQAEDDGIWFVADTLTEAFLQEKIRLLHRHVELVHAALESEFQTKQ